MWERRDVLRGLMSRHLHHTEVLLRDQMPFHPEAEFIAPRSGEDQRGDIDPEIGNLKAVADSNIWESGSADKLFVVEVDQIDVEVIGPLGIGETEIEAHEAFLLGDAVLNDLVADQEGLHAGFRDVRHTAIVRESSALSKRMCFSTRSQLTAPVVAILIVGSGHTRSESVVYREATIQSPLRCRGSLRHYRIG